MNVLILLTDQQQRRTLGAYGNRIVRTPNLDRFAAGATIFDSAICAQPLCSPSRASLFTGLYPHAHGLVDNYHPLTRQVPTIAELLVDRGVRTGYLGKWHLGNEVLPQRGFEQFYRAVDDEYTGHDDLPLYGPCGYAKWLIDKGMQPDSTKRPGTFTRRFTSRLPKHLSKPHFIAEQATRFLEARRNQPFFLVCSFLEPHNPYHSHYDDLHDRDSIPLPDNFHTHPLDGWPARNEAFQRWARTVAHDDEEAFNSEAKWRDVTARYWGACHLVDEYAGQILEQLDRLDLSRDTLVIYTSDHGDMMGAHGMIMKSMMFEESQGVPLIVRHPHAGAAPGRRVRQPVCLVDLLPTILETMGADHSPHAHGRSLVPLLHGGPEDHAAVAVCEWNGVIQNMFRKHEMFAGVKDQHIRSIRTSRWKLNLSDSDRPELYDLHADPGEMRNRVYDGGCRDVVGDLFDRLQNWQRVTRDTLPLQWP